MGEDEKNCQATGENLIPFPKCCNELQMTDTLSASHSLTTDDTFVLVGRTLSRFLGTYFLVFFLLSLSYLHLLPDGQVQVVLLTTQRE